MVICLGRHGFAPAADRDTDYTIVTCRETRPCTEPGGVYCSELAACEVLDKRCAKYRFGSGCDGRCSACEAVVN